MPGFSSYSQVVEPAGYIEPVSLDLLAKGTMYKEQMLEQNLEEVQNLMYNAENIPSLQGIDTEKKNEILKKVKEQVSQLSYSDLTNPAIANQLKGYITSVTKDPDMQGIMQRGYSYETELSNKKEAAKKGNGYYSSILVQAQDYLDKGLYLKDKRFSGQGAAIPEISKLVTDALKNVTKVKKNVYSNGKWIPTESYDDDALKTSLTDEVFNRPDIQDYLYFQTEQQYKDFNWEDEGVKKIQGYLTAYEDQKTKANLVLKTDPTNQNALTAISDADNFINKYTPLISNPGALGENLKQATMKDMVAKVVQERIAAADFTSEEAIVFDQFALNSQKLQDDILKENLKLIAPGAIALGIDPQVALKNPALAKQALAETQRIQVSTAAAKYEANASAKASILKEGVDNISKITDTTSITYTDAASGKDVKIQYKDVRESLKNSSNENLKNLVTSIYNTANPDKPITVDDLVITGKGDNRQLKIKKPVFVNDEIIYVEQLLNENNFIPAATTTSSTPNSNYFDNFMEQGMLDILDDPSIILPPVHKKTLTEKYTQEEIKEAAKAIYKNKGIGMVNINTIEDYIKQSRQPPK
jgi:hypothetical protein